MTRVGGAHHVLGIEGLLGQLRDSEGTVLLRTTGSEGGEANHKEVQTGEGDKVNGKFAEVGVELTGEAEAASDTGHSGRHEVVEVTVSGGGELEGTEADIVQGLVVDNHDFVGVLDELVDGQGGVVGLNDGVGHLGGREDGEGSHHPVGVFLTDLGDKESTHTRTSTTTHRVGDLETLEAVARLGFFTDNVEDRVDQFSTFGVVTLGPVVTGSGLSEDEVVRAEDLAKRTGTDGVHGTGLEVHKDGTRDIAASSSFVVVNVDTFELEIRVAVVGTGRVNTVLVADDFPELGTDLVTALASLDVNDFAHGES
mmetsp:Transcript_21139/g.29810  ORF Transcript_21139/g.29810 Transcript_21139/m.29810 type:complete len:311 (+) Transcript_21139:547-1479(+)